MPFPAVLQCSCRWSAQNRWRFWADLTFCWHRSYLSWILIGKTTRKKNVFFRPSPERGGEGRPLPNFMAHFYHVLLSKLGKFYPKPFIFVCYLVIFCHHYHQNYHHNYHCNRDYQNWYFSCRFWLPKKVQVARNGGEGERGNLGNAWKKAFFLWWAKLVELLDVSFATETMQCIASMHCTG